MPSATINSRSLNDEQVEMLILNTKDEVVEGRSLATFLQEAVTQDDIGVLKRFKAACEVLYEKEEKASKEKRLLASMHQRILAVQGDTATKSQAIGVSRSKPPVWSTADAAELAHQDVYVIKHSRVPTAEERFSEVLNTKLKETTITILAAQNHSTKVMEFLVQQSRSVIDIEQEGLARFEGEERIHGATPLWTAAAQGCADIVKILVQAGACVNHSSATNSTPLRAACYDGFFEVVTFLANNGGDINIRNRYGSGALHLASYRGFADIVLFLLNRGADPNVATSSDRETPLHHAALQGHADVVKILVENGADINLVSVNKLTALLSAAGGGWNAVCDVIITCSPKPPSDVEKAQAWLLLGASSIDKHEDVEAARMYWSKALRIGSAAGMSFASGPLKTSAVYRNVTFPKSMEELDYLTQDLNARAFLALAIREHILGPSNSDTIYYIRCRGAVEADAKRYSSALMLWQHCARLEMEHSRKQNTSEVMASLTTCTELLAEEIKLTGDGDVRSLFDLTWSNMARHPSGSVECGKTLRILLTLLYLWQDLSENVPSHWPTCKDRASLLVSQNIVLNKSYYGYTPLHMVCDKKTFVNGAKSRKNICHYPCPSLLHLLLEAGGDEFISVKDHRGNTPLHIAAQSSSIGCVRELLYYLEPSNVHAHNCEDKTPTDLASSDAIKILLSNYPAQATKPAS